MDRPSPSQSATLFKTGTTKQGNDGNMWTIVENKNGVKKWQKQKDEVQNIKFVNGEITEFKLPSINSLENIGTIVIYSSVVVGEFSYAKSLPNFKEGTYWIYRADDNLILSKQKLTEKKIINSVWKYSGQQALVDGGTFGFWDLKYVRALSSFDNRTIYKKSSKINRIPDFFTAYTRKNSNDAIIIKIRDLTRAKEYIDDDFNADENIGVVSPTGTGDGAFRCYINDDKTAAMLVGGLTTMKLYDVIDKQLPGNLQRVKEYRQRRSRKSSRKSSRKGSRKGSRKTIRKNSRKGSIGGRRKSRR